MKTTIKKLAIVAIVLAILVSLVACNTTVAPQNKDIAVQSVSLDKSEASLLVDEQITLALTITPQDATDKSVVWTSSDGAVATVENGTVTAVGEGTATITATVGGKSASCVVVVSTPPKYVRVNEQGEEDANGKFVLFGSYPATKVEDESIITALGEFDESTWTSYRYYFLGEPSDCMYYIDKQLNGERYRGVYYKQYRPLNSLNDPIYPDEPDDEFYHNLLDKGYELNTPYWFKWEPIKWEIIEESNGFATLLSVMILDNQEFYELEADRTIDGEVVHSNNYKHSKLRRWLNEDFYNLALSAEQQTIVQTSTLDNSVESTLLDANENACEDTQDKVYVFSCAEAVAHREKKGDLFKNGTAYAQSQGLTIRDWWTRSPYNDNAFDVHYINQASSIMDNASSYSLAGVAPVLRIQL